LRARVDMRSNWHDPRLLKAASRPMASQGVPRALGMIATIIVPRIVHAYAIACPGRGGGGQVGPSATKSEAWCSALWPIGRLATASCRSHPRFDASERIPRK